MTIQYKGVRENSSILNEFENYLELLPNNIRFEYLGMEVEIVPYLSFTSKDVLIFWQELEEGFNDKIIFNTLEEFLNEFKIIENA